MSWWKKESKTSFKRNEAGKVIAVVRSGDDPRGAPVSNALLKQYYQKHPEEHKIAKAKKSIGNVAKRFDNYSKEYAMNRPKRSRPQIRKPTPPLSYSLYNNFNPIGDRYDKGRPKQKKQSTPKYTVIGGKAYPIAGTGKKKKKKTTRKKQTGYDIFDNHGLWR